MTLQLLVTCVACGSNDDSSTGSGGTTSTSPLGGRAQTDGRGGASSQGGISASAGKPNTSLGGAPASGGTSSGTSGGSLNTSSGGLGASGASGGKAAANAGGTTTSYAGSIGSGGYPAMVPPPAKSDGSSPYTTECHGDTRTCIDVANLRCLGIRDGTQVNGYSCSNPCQSDKDCSTAPSGVSASAACVDFVTQKHCLLTCLTNGTRYDCPTGMNCYVYPGSNIGYCLWP
ncbi:MAG: hypothetical protein ACOY0T_31715 [Myxococcota bacterium]